MGRSPRLLGVSTSAATRIGADVDAKASDFDTFVLRHQAALLRSAYLITGNQAQAEDLVQDALVKALRQWGRSPTPAEPLAYVRRILINEYLSWRRKLSSRELPTESLRELPAADSQAAVDDRDVLWRALATLPRTQRVVLALRYFDDLPDREIALALGCAEGTVRSLASRAFTTLRAVPGLGTTITGDDHE